MWLAEYCVATFFAFFFVCRPIPADAYGPSVWSVNVYGAWKYTVYGSIRSMEVHGLWCMEVYGVWSCGNYIKVKVVGL